jgi:hypothetical protein
MLWSQFSAIFANFLRFLPIFCEQIGVFLKNQSYYQNFAYFSFVLSQKRQFFRWIFRQKYFKIITSVPEAEGDMQNEERILCSFIKERL